MCVGPRRDANMLLVDLVPGVVRFKSICLSVSCVHIPDSNGTTIEPLYLLAHRSLTLLRDTGVAKLMWAKHRVQQVHHEDFAADIHCSIGGGQRDSLCAGL